MLVYAHHYSFPQHVYYNDFRKITHTLHTYIPLTLYPRKGSRDISDIQRVWYIPYQAETYMHLLTWVGFGLLGYVPNTLYIWDVCWRTKTPIFYQNDLAMRNTADVTGGKPIAVWTQTTSGASAINSLVAFYDIHRRKEVVLFFFFWPGHHTIHNIRVICLKSA
jgi:hypothetical protein